MKRLVIIILFISLALLVAVGVTKVLDLSINVSLLIAGVSCTLLYLMLDLRPDSKPNDATIIRLTRGAWNKRRR